MAEVSRKRQHDAVDANRNVDLQETHISESESNLKKQKSIKQILSILEQDESEPDPDLSSLMLSLESEIICTLDFDSLSTDPTAAVIEDSTVGTASPVSKSSEDGDEKERVMRHLLEASDDELGLPASKSTDEIGDGVVIDGGDSFGFCKGMWELEDEAANYYTLLQSELFM